MFSMYRHPVFACGFALFVSGCVTPAEPSVHGYLDVANGGLQVDYFSGMTLATKLTSATDSAIDHDWGFGAPTDVPVDNFSVRWTSELTPPAPGTYTFYMNSDDGVRLWIDDELVIDDWTDHSVRETTATLDLTADSHALRVEYYDNTEDAIVQLSWSSPTLARQIIPASAFTFPDAGGADGGDPTSETIDDTAIGTGPDQITYTGAWLTSSDAAKYGGTDHYTAAADATYVVHWTGTGIQLYGAKAPHHGIAAISIDGGSETLVDFYAATRADQVAVFTQSGLASAAHALTLRVTGTHAAAATNSVISVDRIDLASGGGTTTPPPGGGGGGGGGTTTPPPTGGFLTRQGKDLMLDGEVFKFVGVNAFGLTGCRTGTPDTQAVMDAFFSSLRPHSITRTWAFQPQGLTGVDRVVATAERFDQKVIFALADGADYCGDDGHDAAFYAGGFRGAYFDWVRQVVPRYKDSPAIGIWEIMNEPGRGSTDAVMRTFFDETAALIKSLDPNHLVGTGTLAEYASGTMDYAYVHGGPNIDVGSLHEYDYTYENSRTIISGHLEPTLSAMSSINKPLYVGETGIGLTNTCVGPQERASVLVQKLDGYLSRGAIGVLYWGWASNSDDGCDPYSGASEGLGSPLMNAIKSYMIH